MREKVAILGAGPAGLLAAHALDEAEIGFAIYSVPDKSLITGAQYLHRPIPNLTEPHDEFEISFRKMGWRTGYAEKIYGDENAPTSWDEFPNGGVSAWRLDATYDRLWDRYEKEIRPTVLIPGDIPEILESHEHVISSVPRLALCAYPDFHEFRSVPCYVESVTPAQADIRSGVLDLSWHTPDPPTNYVIYNGIPGYFWYRASSIGSMASFEYGANGSSAVPGPMWKGVKPLGTDCDCWPGVHRVGRFGRWEKRILVHHAYEEVCRLLKDGLR